MFTRYGEEVINVQMGRESDPDFEIHQHLLRKDIKFGEYIDMVLNGGPSNDYYITANNHMLNRKGVQGMLEDVKPFFPGFMKQQVRMESGWGCNVSKPLFVGRRLP